METSVKKKHIYVVGSQAYNSLRKNKEDQFILVTGESGLGKIENVREFIEYLTLVAGNKNNGIEKRIIL